LPAHTRQAPAAFSPPPFEDETGHDATYRACGCRSSPRTWTAPISGCRSPDGRSYVVLISAEDLASLGATVERLSDPEAMQRVRQAQTDLEVGDFITGKEMAELMKQRSATATGG
jgi:hypothetical protein